MAGTKRKRCCLVQLQIDRSKAKQISPKLCQIAISGLLEICSNCYVPSMAPYGMEGAWLWNPKSQTYTVECFNVSNLMGNKWRMIDIGKKLLFTFCKMFESVQFFSHLQFKYAKSAIKTPKNFSWKISIWVSKKRRILCWFQIRWCRLKQMPLKKSYSCLSQTRTGIGLLGKPSTVKQFPPSKATRRTRLLRGPLANAGMKRTSVVEHNLYFAGLAMVG